MPNQPKTPHRSIRVGSPKWDDFSTVAEGQGTDRTKLINRFIDWYLGVPDAELPERPTPEHIRELLDRKPQNDQ